MTEVEQLRSEWSVMARACGNYRDFGMAVTPEATERRRLIADADYEAAARAIVERDLLRTALIGLVGASTRAELEDMEVVLRAAPAPAEDKAAAIDGIHALLATLPLLVA